jgi:hypothetical protein
MAVGRDKTIHAHHDYRWRWCVQVLVVSEKHIQLASSGRKVVSEKHIQLASSGRNCFDDDRPGSESEVSSE